jgi:hypothetical protein
MKTSLGDDCVAINLDYDAVKEVVQIYQSNYERPRLSTSERDKNFTLRLRVTFAIPSIETSREIPNLDAVTDLELHPAAARQRKI